MTRVRRGYVERTERGYVVTTQKHLRALFWQAHPDFNPQPKWTQNKYCATIRTAWGFFVDTQQKAGNISPALAKRACL